jgi:hypothetical protein
MTSPFPYDEFRSYMSQQALQSWLDRTPGRSSTPSLKSPRSIRSTRSFKQATPYSFDPNSFSSFGSPSTPKGLRSIQRPTDFTMSPRSRPRMLGVTTKLPPGTRQNLDPRIPKAMDFSPGARRSGARYFHMDSTPSSNIIDPQSSVLTPHYDLNTFDTATSVYRPDTPGATPTAKGPGVGTQLGVGFAGGVLGGVASMGIGKVAQLILKKRQDEAEAKLEQKAMNNMRNRGFF